MHLEFKKCPLSYCELFLLLLASMLNVGFKKWSFQNVRFEGQEPRLEYLRSPLYLASTNRVILFYGMISVHESFQRRHL